MRKLTGGFLLGLAWTGPAVAQTASDPAVAARVERYLEPLIRGGALSGSVLLARGDSILYQSDFGWIDHPEGRPLTAGTPIAVASIAKLFTGIVVQALIAQGRVSLDDRVSRWLPDFPAADRITIDLLLSHRAGIRHRVSGSAYDFQPQTAATMVPRIAAESLLFEPGSRRVYSSMGYVVLARMLELAGGKPYWQLVQELVLAPAGARHTFDATRPAPLPPFALPYFIGSEGEIRRPRRDLSFLVGAGSLYSTPADLFAVFRRLRRGDYGSPARERLTRESVVWSGLTDGYRAVLQQDSTGITVIFATNYVTGAGDWVLRDLPRIARGETVSTPEIPRPRTVAMTRAAMEHFSGAYQFLPEFWTPLEFVSPSAAFAGDFVLLPTSDSTFFSVFDYAPVHAVRAPDGAVTGLRWGNGNLVFARRPGRTPSER